MADAASIADAVERAIGEASTRLRPDVRLAMEAAAEEETGSRGGKVLRQLIENDDVAQRDRVPLCQDTGTVWVWVELGSEVCLEGDLEGLVREAVARAYRDHSLRMSVATDALLDRTNTGDNTPAFVDVTMRPGRGATVHVMLKGGGSDNASTLAMLDPEEGMDGVRDFVVEHVLAKATGACPPLLVGVGVGSTFDGVAKLAKKALLRPIGSTGDARLGSFERELLELINVSGVGPAGLGGRTTALAVHVVTAPSHIASLPVAVNMGCSAVRSATVEVA
jgi:fumarate hydratase class I/fumarate hydratase subunit alpha